MLIAASVTAAAETAKPVLALALDEELRWQWQRHPSLRLRVQLCFAPLTCGTWHEWRGQSGASAEARGVARQSAGQTARSGKQRALCAQRDGRRHERVCLGMAMMALAAGSALWTRKKAAIL